MNAHALTCLAGIDGSQHECTCVPKLRHGERQGDLMSAQPAEAFALVTESGPDNQARADQEAQAEKDRQAQDLLQRKLL